MVSVIVPVYNVQEYLSQCVDSILQQTYTDIEIILVDDGSPDCSGEICDAYSYVDHRVKVIHKKNGGLSDARNTGLEIASGEFVLFVDSDDFISKNTLEISFKIASETNADIVQINSVRCLEEDNYKTFLFHDADDETLIFTNRSKMQFLFSPHKIATTSWGKLYKKTLFDHIRFPYGKLHEDVYTTYLLIHEANIIAISKAECYAYRINYHGIMNSKFNEKHLDAIDGKIEQEKFIQRHYPQLILQAKSDVIHACNACLKNIIISRYNNRDTILKLQTIYREYGISYIKSHTKSWKKFVCILAMINTNATINLLKLLHNMKMDKFDEDNHKNKRASAK